MCRNFIVLNQENLRSKGVTPLSLIYNFLQENPSQVIFRSLSVKESHGDLEIANDVTRIFPLIFLPEKLHNGAFILKYAYILKTQFLSVRTRKNIPCLSGYASLVKRRAQDALSV